MKKLIYIALILLPFQSISQFSPKEKYLIDSLDLSKVSEKDKNLIDSTLLKYNNEISLGKQIEILFQIVDNCNNENICENYLEWMNKIILKEKELKKEKFEYTEHLIKIKIKQGYFADMNGKVKLALKIYFDALKDAQNIKDSTNEATIKLSIGNLYYGLYDFNNAYNYFKQSLALIDTNKYHLNLGSVYLHFGTVLEELNKPDSVLYFYKKGLKVLSKIGDTEGIANAYFNIAHFHKKNGNYEKALKNLLNALNLIEDIGFKIGISSTSHSIGEIYLLLNNLELAEKYALKSHSIANETGYPELIKISTQLLSKIYDEKGESKKAFSMYKQYIVIRDSLRSNSNKKEALEQRTKHEYEKKKALDDAENDKKVAIQIAENEKQKIITYSIFGGLILVVLFLLFVYNRLQLSKKRNIKIEEQKNKIEHQKEIVEAAHKEIKDSINYAKRIQSAILPKSSILKKFLPESFVLYKPKDVVAGDFYWLEPNNDTILFASADCTGHGVPGAMVSVVCHNAMNRAVREFKLSDPGLILDKTRELVITEFEKSEDDVKDGMDIALCSLNGNKLQYAGAHNPLWIIKDNKLTEIKANKQPIGMFDNPTPFTTHTIELEKGDSIYVFSDGFADQFGGPKDKKFSSKRFKNLLISIQDKSMDEQNKIINLTFNNWKEESNSEQVDDICIIGVKI